jgi:disulfide oxidoreductase YuzD
MSALAFIEIVGAPVACADGVTDSWRELALWVTGQIKGRYGTNVSVTYHDLFDPGCPSLSENTQLPVVLVNGEVLTSGGKISMPVIRRRLKALGISPNGH